MNPIFSICIPNYNYGNYIGETIESVINQTFANFELCITDNASTDNSWEVIKSYAQKDNRIKISQNSYNVGFAGNLDKVSSLATGDWHIMLSSDDLISKNTLEIYHQILVEHNFDPLLLINSGFEQFDNENYNIKSYIGYNKYIWQKSKPTNLLSNTSIIIDNTSNILKHGLEKFVSPFNFVALCYSKTVYKNTNGYGNTRMMNPDRWFHWNACTIATQAIFIDLPLFQYRWHNNNQTAKQIKSGVLKFWIDEYRNCFELNELHFNKSGLTKAQIELLFFRKVIIGYGFASLAYGLPLKSLRITAFGIFTYPTIFFKSPKAIILLLAMLVYPITWSLSNLIQFYFKRRI